MASLRAFFLCLLFLTGVTAAAQSPAARANYGALLEPADGLLHGAGQSPDAFADYWAVMPHTGQPAVYMHYVGLRGMGPDWSAGLKRELDRYDAQGRFVIAQIGLSMTQDGNPSAHYEGKVAIGAMDAEIEHLIEGIRRLGYPVYLRIGYEFNGKVWNGYIPVTYRLAYQRITDAIRAANLEVATVWCMSMDGDTNLFDFYPGDEYVDWFGIDVFSTEHFADVRALAFMSNAHARNKPVMLGETTPRGFGAQDPGDWNDWFVPFFNFMNEQPGLKLFSYINWDWAEWSARLGANWSGWGDARLETSAAIRPLYNAALTDPVYLHAESEFNFRQRLGHDDTTPPAAIDKPIHLAERPGAWIEWMPVEDPSGIAHYVIYRDGQRHDRTLMLPYEDKRSPLGTHVYQISAVDRAGNEGPMSEALEVTTLFVETIKNGEFDLGLDDWQLDMFAANLAASVTVDATAVLSGPNAAHVQIASNSGTEWHIQLRQAVGLTAGTTYSVRLQARASTPVTFPMLFQKWDTPHTIYHSESVTVGTEPTTISWSYTASATDAVAFTLFIGAIGNVEIWIDEVSMIEGSTTGLITDPAQTPLSFPLRLGAVYPNPVLRAASIEIELATAAGVALDVYDVLGRTMLSKPLGRLAAGLHEVDFHTDTLLPGLYLARVRAGGQRATALFSKND